METIQVAALRKAVTDTNKPSLPADVTAALTAFDTKIGAIGGRAGGRGAGPGGGGGAQPAGAAPPAPNFAAVHGALLRQLATLDSGDMAPNESMTKVFESSCKDLKTAAANWTAATATDLPALECPAHQGGSRADFGGLACPDLAGVRGGTSRPPPVRGVAADGRARRSSTFDATLYSCHRV
jgi:hypothetical protein